MSRFNTSRFANPNRTDVLDLGPCQCPDRRKTAGPPPREGERRSHDRGTPHERDQYVHRLELGAAEEERAGTYGWSSTGWAYFDSAAARAKLVEVGGITWNLLGPDGEAMPLNARSGSLLDAETLEAITKRLDEVTAVAEEKPLPNRRCARSAGSSPASASRPRTTRKRT